MWLVLCIIVAMLTGLERLLQSVERARQRRALALALRKKGKTFQQIAARFKISRQRAAELVKRAQVEA